MLKGILKVSTSTSIYCEHKNSLEHRRIEQSLTIFFKCFKEDGPCHIGNLFKPQITPYNLRNSGVNVKQSPYNSKFLHGSFSVIIIISYMERLPASKKNTQDIASFRRLLKKQNFTGCQCNDCIWYFLINLCIFFHFYININMLQPILDF